MYPAVTSGMAPTWPEGVIGWNHRPTEVPQSLSIVSTTELAIRYALLSNPAAMSVTVTV